MKRHVILTFTVLLFCAKGAWAGLSSHDSAQLAEAFQKVPYIFEGEVTGKQSYWNEEEAMIYTAYKIKVSKYYRGELRCGTVELVSKGGRVEDQSISVSHTMELNVGVKGMFLCQETEYPESEMEVNNRITMQHYVGDNGFFHYYNDGLNPPVAGFHTTFSTMDQFYTILNAQSNTNKRVCEAEAIIEPHNNRARYQQPDTVGQTIPEHRKKRNKRIKRQHIQRLQKMKKIAKANEAKIQSKKGGANNINFEFANPKVTGTNPGYFEFDIMVWGNNSNTYVSNAYPRIGYNTNAFGQNVVSNGKISYTIGSNFDIPTYEKRKYDYTDSSFSISIAPDQSQSTYNRHNLTSTKIKYAHVKIELSQGSCYETSDLTFDPVISFFYNQSSGGPTANDYSYDNQYFNNPINVSLCKPKINNINPLTIHGGTGEMLTITGSGFGNNPGSNGKVYLRNADNGGDTHIPLDAYDIESWSNTQIKVKVPS
jgi:hypothetical protein